MNTNRRVPSLSRRQAVRAGTVLGAGLVGARLLPPAFAAGRTLAIADVGVGDPGGDWSRFEQPSGDQVNLVSIGNAPSAVVNQLIAGGGQTTFDVINIVGGMQKPLVDNDLILELDPSRLANWQGNSYIEQYLASGTPGFTGWAALIASTFRRISSNSAGFSRRNFFAASRPCPIRVSP